MVITPTPPFPAAAIEKMARILGECGTGSNIDRALERCGLADGSGVSTKWRRLDWIFTETQRRYERADEILSFIKEFLHPVTFAEDEQAFEAHRAALNRVLAFSGIEYGEDGEFRPIHPAHTIADATQRAKGVTGRLESRGIHPEVLKYCKAEIMSEDYFHALFEASKGLAQRIRELSGASGDGAKLVDTVFSMKQPILAFNSLQTETEKSEHRGFAELLKGCFAAVRNPGAHEPRILWKGEDDAADYLTLISLLHRKLDACERVAVEDIP